MTEMGRLAMTTPDEGLLASSAIPDAGNPSCAKCGKSVSSAAAFQAGDSAALETLANNACQAVSRWRLVLLGGSLLALLSLARGLSPDESGVGTHRQLGLPACTTQVLFGVRCPACGMTTSWAYLTRGAWSKAFYANPGGALLGIVTALVAAWAFGSAIVGRYLVRRPPPAVLAVLASLIAGVTLVHWVWRLGQTF